MNEFEDDRSKDDQIVVITDLDATENVSRFTRMFMDLEQHPSLRKRFLRIGITSGTVLLILLVLFSTFSSVRGLTFSLFSRFAPFQSTVSATTTATPVDLNEFNAKEVI